MGDWTPIRAFGGEGGPATPATASSMAIMVFLVKLSPRNSHAATAVRGTGRDDAASCRGVGHGEGFAEKNRQGSNRTIASRYFQSPF